MTSSIEKAVTRWRNWREKKFLKKTKRPCTAFVAQRSWHRWMACNRNWYSHAMQHLLDDPDAAMDAGTVLKAGNSSTVVKITMKSQTLVIKRYNIKSRRHALRRCMRPSRAMVSWTNAHRLRFLGIDTPQPLAVIEERWGWLRKRAYFIMAHLPARTIDQVLRDHAHDPSGVIGCLDQLEALLKRLAAAQISHGDFKATNFLISSGRLFIVDLDGMRRYRYSSTFKHAFHKDLQRLQRNWRDSPELNRRVVSLTDRLIHTIEME